MCEAKDLGFNPVERKKIHVADPLAPIATTGTYNWNLWSRLLQLVLTAGTKGGWQPELKGIFVVVRGLCEGSI